MPTLLIYSFNSTKKIRIKVTSQLTFTHQLFLPFYSHTIIVQNIAPLHPLMMSEKKQFKSVHDKAIIPMTIHQVQNALIKEDEFENQRFHTISILGRLESFRREARSNMIMFNDGTGSIQGQINTQDGKMPPYTEGINFDEEQGEYFFVVLKPKFSQEENRKKFYVHMVRPIKDYNYITKHMSDIILSHLIRKKH